MKTMQKRSNVAVSTATFLLLYVLLMSTCHPVRGECHEAKGGNIKFTLQNQRNSTGHRNFKMLLSTRATPGISKADLGGVEVREVVNLCEGVEIIDMWVTINAPPSRVRPPGYEVFPGMGYYKFHPKSATWNEAYESCVSEGSNLIDVNSEAEAHVVRQYLNRKTTVEGSTWPGWCWAGFHDRGIEGEYRTVHGGLLKDTGYVKWHPGQPDNKPWGSEPDQDCGSINKDALMNDLPCLGKLPFICEQPI